METTKRLISSGSPYEPIIGFSRAVRVGDTIAVSGTAPIAPDGSTAGVGDAVVQMRRCLEIVRQALERAGAGLDNVIRTRTFLARIEDWRAVGEVHGEYFREARPASTMVEVARFIDPEWLVEVEVDAIVPGGR